MLPRLLQLLLPVSALLLSPKLSSAQSQGYYGKYIGRLKTLHHKVSGEVFAVDTRTLHIRDFNYDGEGPAAYFYAGNSKNPGPNGFRIADEQGLQNPLKPYQRKHVTITLPDGKTLNNIKWFSVWCDEFAVNFGDVKIPKNLDYPRPQKIDPLNGVHLVSSEPIVVVDAQTLLIPSFSYDGEAPDAKFWVGRGNKPSPQGIRVPDENGKEVPLRRYDRKTIVLTLPGDTTIFDIGHFGVWCEAFAVDFGHVRIPRGLNIPPSLKMLGVSPQKIARSLELAQEQIRNQQLVFNNPEQFRGGVPSGDPSFFNNYFNSDNTFYRDQQQFSSSPSLTGSSSNQDIQNLLGQNIRATTYKPTFNNNLQQNHQQQIHNQNYNHQQFVHQQRQPQASQTSFVSQPLQRDSSSSVEILPSITLADTSFTGQSPPPPPSPQAFDNNFQHAQERSFNIVQQRPFIPTQQQTFNAVPSQERSLNIVPSQERSLNIFSSQERLLNIIPSQERFLNIVPSQQRSLNFLPTQERPVSIVQSQERSLDNLPSRYFNPAQTQQSNTFIGTNPAHFNNNALPLHYQPQHIRPNNVAESRIHNNHIAINNINDRPFSRVAFNGAGGIQYK